MSSIDCLYRPISLGLLATAAAIVSAGAALAEPGVVISSGATANLTCTSGVCTPSKRSATLNVTQLQGLLASGNVKVTTGGARSLSITVDANLSWASANRLTLDAYQSITIDKAVAVNGTGGLTLTTNDGGTGGALSFGKNGHVGFLSTTNSLTINGAAYTLVADTTTLASDIASHAGGDFALAGDYDAKGNPSNVATTFNGRFEGLGNTISHLGHAGGNAMTGLFSEVGASGTVADVRLVQFTSSRGNNVGALASLNDGTLSGDSATGSINVATQSGGGLVAVNAGSVTNCFSTVTVANTKRGQVVLGGLVGSNNLNGTIVDSYASGAVSSKGEDQDGGLVGFNEGAIDNSFASGAVVGFRNAVVGGLVGYDSFDGGSAGTIANSYASGGVSVGTGNTVGGLIGFASEAGGMTDTYWDISTSGNGHGAGNISADPGITGLSNTQLQAGLPAGFSSTIWGENTSINGGLPYLLALPPAG